MRVLAVPTRCVENEPTVPRPSAQAQLKKQLAALEKLPEQLRSLGSSLQKRSQEQQSEDKDSSAEQQEQRRQFLVVCFYSFS